MAENKTKPTDASVEDFCLPAEGESQRSLLSKLGKHRMSKVCLYFRRLADLDKPTLKQLITGSVADVRQRFG
jgi:hypothetical protein